MLSMNYSVHFEFFIFLFINQYIIEPGKKTKSICHEFFLQIQCIDSKIICFGFSSRKNNSNEDEIRKRRGKKSIWESEKDSNNKHFFWMLAFESNTFKNWRFFYFVFVVVIQNTYIIIGDRKCGGNYHNWIFYSNMSAWHRIIVSNIFFG